jgi:hypothetical protein
MTHKHRLEALESAPPNSWVVFSEDESRVIGVASTYGDAVEIAEKEGVDDPVLVKTPAEWLTPVF